MLGYPRRSWEEVSPAGMFGCPSCRKTQTAYVMLLHQAVALGLFGEFVENAGIGLIGGIGV